MKKFEFKIIDRESGRVLDSRIEANSLLEAKMLIKIIYRTDQEVTRLIGVPKEVSE